MRRIVHTRTSYLIRLTLRYLNYSVNARPSVPEIQAARNYSINTQASLPGIQAPVSI